MNSPRHFSPLQRRFARMYCVLLTVGLSACVTPVQAVCSPPPGNLLAWWSADGTASDLVSGHHATLANGTYFDNGYVAGAFALDGIDDWVQTPLDAQPSALPVTTWEAWVFPTRSDGRRQILSTDDGGFDRSLLIENGTFAVFTGSGRWLVVQADLYTWQHVAVVYTSTQVRFYKNGTEYTLMEAPVGQDTGYLLCIGRNPGYGEYFSGLIDEVGVYDRALTAAEITSIVSAGMDGKCKPFMNSADLAVTMTSTLSEADFEQEVEYTLELVNYGPDTAMFIQIEDQLPRGFLYLSSNGPQGPGIPAGQQITFTHDNLAPGGSVSFTVLAQAGYTGSTAATNQVVVTASETDPYVENNRAQHVLLIRGAALYITEVSGTVTSGGPLWVYTEGDPADYLGIPSYGGEFQRLFTLSVESPNTLLVAAHPWITIGGAGVSIILSGLEANADWLGAEIVSTGGLPTLTYSGGDTATLNFNNGQGYSDGDQIRIIFTAPPTLSLLRNGDQTMSLSWTGAGMLEQTGNLTTPNWQPAPSQNNPQILSTTNPIQFFRVIQ